jgi:hypothetical protein
MKALLAVAGITLLPLAGCTSKPALPAINQQATLNGSLPYNPLAWKVITSSLNERNSTTSTLYGNDIAVQYARTNPDHTYPAGAVLALVTWSQRDDPHWFGAKIPSTPKSVEFVTVSSSHESAYTYESYQGSPLQKVALSDNNLVRARVEHLLSQRASVMP